MNRTSAAKEEMFRSVRVYQEEKRIECTLLPTHAASVETLRATLAERFYGWDIQITSEEAPNPDRTAFACVEDCLLDAFPSLRAYPDGYSIDIDEDHVHLLLPPLFSARFTDEHIAEKLQNVLLEQFPDACFQIHMESLAPEGNDCTPDPALFESVAVKNGNPANRIILQAESYPRWKKQNKKHAPDPIPIAELQRDTPAVCVEAEILGVERDIVTKRGRRLLLFDIYDGDSTACSVLFEQSYGEKHAVETQIKTGARFRIYGEYRFDTYTNHDVLSVQRMDALPRIAESDNVPTARVELHLHSTMSATDGLIDPKALFSRLKEWGHRAVAVTDHGVVQSYPFFAEQAKKTGIKAIYGMEAYIVEGRPLILKGQKERYDRYVVFDLETTGLNHRQDRIIEIGAVKVEHGRITERFSQLVDPQIPLQPEIVSLTGITNSDLAGKPTIDKVLPAFLSFAEDCLLVAHNATFDVSFIRRDARALGLPFSFDSLDTLPLAQLLFPEQRSHRLDRMAKALDVRLDDHHRALEDAEATAHIFFSLLKLAGLSKESITPAVNAIPSDRNPAKNRPVHINLLVQTQEGLRNLYELVSESHLDTFYMTPRIRRSSLEKRRTGLLLGSSCADGPVVAGMLDGLEEEEIRNRIRALDYIELQPPACWAHLINQGNASDTEDLRTIQKTMIRLAKEEGKPVVATSDAHFLQEKDMILRDIVKSGRKMADPKQRMPVHLRSTGEMLADFAFLGEELAYEIVVENSNRIADSIDSIVPVLPGTHTPTIPGSEKILRDLVWKNAVRQYGDPLPTIVSERLERELHSIISNGYAVLYIISEKLVRKSNEDGYVVGSRGSVGSSFVATMAGISEVNPLVPHYLCEECQYSEFIEDGSVDTGIDLPNKKCPVCGATLKKEGHDIPFEVFLGFEGDKEPDIDLNFAGEYQSVAHKFVEELFGREKVIRAGTIGTIKDRTAYGYVRSYLEERGIFVHPAEERRLMRGIIGVKRTSSQHPGGIMIVPEERHIHDFTPIQRPADSTDTDIITTHFSYREISKSILKLDILGHDVPTTIRLLQDMTGIAPDKIPMDDRRTMDIFSGQATQTDISTLGIPEFGTNFVQEMLRDTHPTTFGELVRISGLSHGTDVWLGNAKNLIDDGIAELKDTICTRDDIMRSLILWGLEKKDSFDIMESVRKGRGLTPEMSEKMRAKGVPEWYIDSCLKIKYMFPKAHAVAYVLMSYRIAWFKVHYPAAFYASFFTIKIADIPAALLAGQKECAESQIALLAKKRNEKLSAKEESELLMLTIGLEMYARGITMAPIDLYASPVHAFDAKDKLVIPSLRAVPSVSDAMATDLGEERDREFTSQEDILQRTRLNKTAMEGLRSVGALEGLAETNQLSFF